MKENIGKIDDPQPIKNSSKGNIETKDFLLDP
jgi:hypothetical protein